jgi:hypothetical protein
MGTSVETAGATPRRCEQPLDGALAAAIVTAAPMIVVLLDCGGRVEYANPFFERLVGRPLADFRGGDWFEIFVPSRARDGARACFDRLCHGGGPVRDTVHIIVTASGEEREIEWHDPYPHGPGDGPTRLVCIGKDVTEERRGARARHELEQRLASIFENSFDPQGLYAVEPDGELRTVALNRQCFIDTRARGVPLDADVALGKTRAEILTWLGVSAALIAEDDARIRQVIASGESLRYEDCRRIGHTQVHSEMSIAPLLDERGACTHIHVTARDISARVAALRALRASESSLREAQRIGKFGSWELDVPSGALRWSDEIYRIFELDPQHFGASYGAFLAAIHPDDRALVDSTFLRSLATREPYEIVHRLRMADGRVKHVQEIGLTVYDDGGAPLRTTGTVQDITERVHAELRLKRILNGMLPFVGLFDLDGRVLELNREPVDEAGLPLADTRSLHCWELPYFCHSPELQARIRDAITQAAAGGIVQGDYAIHVGGRTPAIYELRFNPLLDTNGQVEGVICSGIDVTARRRIEDDLRIHSQVLLSMGEGVTFLDATTRIRFTNPAIDRMFGYDAGELLGQDVTILNDWSPAETLANTREIMTRLRERGFYEGEFRNRRRDGSIFYSHVVITALVRPGETLWVTIQEDVTERRAVEQEVRRTRDLLRQVIDASPDWIYAKDLSRRFLLVNEAFAAALGVAPEAMVGRPDSDFFTDDLLVGDPARGIRGFSEDDERAMRGAPIRNPEVVAPIAEPRRRLFDTFRAPLRDQEGRAYGMLGHWRDVTRQVEAAESLRRSLAEKETLLREIHHRVKNNLQIISSLLHFQAKTVKNPEDVAAFAEGRRRLLAMLLVHERLYQTKDLSQIEFHGYIGALVRALTRSHDQGHVVVDTIADEILLPIELALPSGMILCELITNVFKYAAAGRDGCHARVSVRCDESRVFLAVDDDGVGFPSGFDPAAVATFGWSLIRDLVLQLDGTLVTRTDNGAHVEFSFVRPVAAAPPESRT